MSPQPFSPPKMCKTCHTELVKDVYDDTVHLENASSVCPDANGAYVHCADEACEAKVKNHYWGKVKAIGWFFSQQEEAAYCPEHVPEWVPAWREERRLRNEARKMARKA